MEENVKKLIKKSEVSFLSGEQEEAISLLDKAEKIAKSQGLIFLRADILLRRGTFYFKRGNYRKAKKDWENSKKLFKSLKEDPYIAQVNYWLGVLLYEINLKEEALEYLNEAYKYYKETQDENKKRKADVSFQRGIASMDVKKWDIAYESLSVALDTYTNVGDEEGVADTLYHIGKLFYLTDDIETAVKYFERSKSKYKDLDIPLRIADCYYRLGDAQIKAKNFAKAKGNFQKAIKIYMEEKEKRSMGDALLKLGNIFKEMRDISRQESCYKVAFNLFEEISEYNNSAYALYNMGNIEKEKGNWKDALRKYTKALTRYRRVLNFKGLADTYLNIAKIYESIEDIENARHFYKQALISYEKGNYTKDAEAVLKKIQELL